MWVYNSMKEACKAKQELRSKRSLCKGNTFQIVGCPCMSSPALTFSMEAISLLFMLSIPGGVVSAGGTCEHSAASSSSIPDSLQNTASGLHKREQGHERERERERGRPLQPPLADQMPNPSLGMCDGIRPNIL